MNCRNVFFVLLSTLLISGTGHAGETGKKAPIFQRGVDPFFKNIECVVVRFRLETEDTDVPGEAMPNLPSMEMAQLIKDLVFRRHEADSLNIYFHKFGQAGAEAECPDHSVTLFYDIKAATRWGRYLNPPMADNFVLLSSSYRRYEPDRQFPAVGGYTPKLLRLSDDKRAFLQSFSDAVEDELKQFIDQPLLKKKYERKDTLRSPHNPKFVE